MDLYVLFCFWQTSIFLVVTGNMGNYCHQRWQQQQQQQHINHRYHR